MSAKIPLHVVLLAGLAFGAPTMALAQAEVVGAIAGALAAQQMTADAEARRMAGLVSSAPAYELHGLCARVRTQLGTYSLRTASNERLAEIYKAKCTEDARP